MNHRNSRSIPLLALVASASGCAYGYAEYRGAEGVPSYSDGSESPGPPVLRYAIPPDAPKGQAYVMSLGVQTYTARDGQRKPMLHLRIALENNSAEPWILDPGDAAVGLDDASPIRPTYATGRQTAGRQTVAPGKRGELDLFFAMPSATRPQQASLTWQVRLGAESTMLNSRFDLMTGPGPGQVYYEPAYDASLAYAWGPGWWWGPSWYWGMGWWWGAPWWWGGWGYPHGGWRGHPMHRGGFGGGYRGGGYYGGGFRGGGGYRGGGFRGGGRR
jgi:uncharacterized membrane protein YgcG